MRALATLLFLLLFAPAASRGQPGGGDEPPPVVGQPPNYSHLIGQFEISTAAAPTKVFVDDPILLTVSIKGDGPRKDYLPQRQFLKIFSKEMKQDFAIGELIDKNYYDAKTRTWHFFYQLQPRNEKVTSIPPLELCFYHGKDFPSSYSDAILLEVKIPPKVIIAPASMYNLAKGENLLRRDEGFRVNWWDLALGLILPPVASVVGYRCWQYYRPSSAGLAKRRQSRAARHALKALRRLRDDPHGLYSGAVFTHYLQTRLDLTPADPTPLETARHLWQAGLTLELTERVTHFYSAAACRFAPEGPSQMDQRREAMGLILAVEEEAR